MKIFEKNVQTHKKVLQVPPAEWENGRETLCYRETPITPKKRGGVVYRWNPWENLFQVVRCGAFRAAVGGGGGCNEGGEGRARLLHGGGGEPQRQHRVVDERAVHQPLEHLLRVLHSGVPLSPSNPVEGAPFAGSNPQAGELGGETLENTMA